MLNEQNFEIKDMSQEEFRSHINSSCSNGMILETDKCSDLEESPPKQKNYFENGLKNTLNLQNSDNLESFVQSNNGEFEKPENYANTTDQRNFYGSQSCKKQYTPDYSEFEKPANYANTTNQPNFYGSQSCKKQYTSDYSTLCSRYPALSFTDIVKAKEEAEKHCNKLFQLKNSSIYYSFPVWNLPSSRPCFDHKPWKINKLQKAKIELNLVKEILETYDLDEWHKHTHKCNLAFRIPSYVRNDAKPELLTQAFLKFYEILHEFPILPEEDKLPNNCLRSLHLCEAPGAFVVALNHFLALERPNWKWKWLGNTFNPYFEGTSPTECIADDRFIKFTLDNWCFGKDETGNLTNSEYVDSLLNRMNGGNKMNLVTADGSIDCQGNPAEQENMTYCLHFCEVYTALRSLCDGGSLVLKKFTIFESESVCLTYFICCCFDNVYVYKPITSKLGNSEVYLVAIGFHPPQNLSEYLDEMWKYYGKDIKNIMFSRQQIPDSFVDQIVECSDFFKTHQIGAIKRNIKLYKKESQYDDHYMHLLKSIVLRIFLENNRCEPIDPTRRIVDHKLGWDTTIIPKGNVSRWGNQIMKKRRMDRIKFLKEQLEEIVKLYSSENRKLTTSYSCTNKLFLDSIEIGCGKRFHLVYFSRFCNPDIYRIYLYYTLERLTENEVTKLNAEHIPELSSLKPAYIDIKVKREREKVRNGSLKIYENCHVIDGGYYLAPHNCHKAFDIIFDMISEEKISEGQNVRVVNTHLFTRLQIGLLLILCCLFKEIEFMEPDNFTDGGVPYFVLKNFNSLQEGRAVIDLLERRGWKRGNTEKNVNQVLPLQILFASNLYPAICRYNAVCSICNCYTIDVFSGKWLNKLVSECSKLVSEFS